MCTHENVKKVSTRGNVYIHNTCYFTDVQHGTQVEIDKRYLLSTSKYSKFLDSVTTIEGNEQLRDSEKLKCWNKLMKTIFNTNFTDRKSFREFSGLEDLVAELGGFRNIPKLHTLLRNPYSALAYCNM